MRALLEARPNYFLGDLYYWIIKKPMNPKICLTTTTENQTKTRAYPNQNKAKVGVEKLRFKTSNYD